MFSPQKLVFEPADHPSMHPGRSARILLGGAPVGFVGELHPRWRQQWELAAAPVVFEIQLDAVIQREVPSFGAVARFQAVERDIAVLVDEGVTHASLMKAIWAAETGGVLRDAVLFDVYRGKPGASAERAAGASIGETGSEKSLAIRLRFNSDVATLTESQIDTATNAVIEMLTSTFGARLRG